MNQGRQTSSTSFHIFSQLLLIKMASISSISKHARSISLPSRSNQISDFNDSEASTSSSSIGLKVNGLRDLYNSVDSLLHLPNTLRSLAQLGQKDVVNELLDELLRLLDLCSTAKDVLLSTMRSAQELQSVLRRKRGDPTGLTHAVQEYQSQRKTVKKAILKVLRDLKRSSSIKHIQETPAVVSLQEVELVTFRVFESLLSFILGSNSQTNSKKWSLVSKLIGSKDAASNESSERSQVEKVDAELAKKSTSLQVVNVQQELVQLDLSLQYLLEELECIYRHLIKTRVSLLNVLNY